MLFFNNSDHDKKNPWGQRPSSQQHRPSDADNVEELFKKGQDRLKGMLRGGGNGGAGSGQNGGFPFSPRVLVLLVLGAFILWMATGIFTINAKEEGVVLRFGEYVRTVGPGLNYHLPSPIEQVVRLRVTDRYKEEIGYYSGGNASLFRRGNEGRNILMLTGDENLVDVSFEVQWQIGDARKFLFNVYNPRATIREAAESAMREIVGTTPINDILSEKRSDVQLRTKALLQRVLDSYDLGVDIKEINMKGVPPRSAITIEDILVDDDGKTKVKTITTTVDEAFKDVQAAKINKEETINKAIAYQNMVIPIARGRAQEVLQKAEGYKQRVVAEAEGEAARFSKIYAQYRYAPDVTRRRMYLDTMEGVLEHMDKVILDTSGSGGVVPYLPLQDFGKAPKTK
jgi:membrane protease subunit HflK